jgi:hypothetical protein
MMKYSVLFLGLFSLNLWARDYKCTLPQYELTLQLDDVSTTLWVSDRWRYETVFVDYVKWVQTVGANKVLYFYPSRGSESKITLSTADYENEPSKSISIFVDGNFDGQMIYQSLKCPEI